MGLDMYLNAKRYLWDHDESDKTVISQLAGMDLGNNGRRIKQLECSIMSWRKANAIHEWFVQNVQHGEDDCKEYYCSNERLKELVDKCKATIANRDQAKELLPTTEGFFFGSTDYDQFYFEDLEGTIQELEPLLADSEFLKNWEFYYSSSW